MTDDAARAGLPAEPRDETALQAARERVYALFDELGVPYTAKSHPPVFSAADETSRALRFDALICKNLFLRNKDKSRYYLYTLPLAGRADLAALARALSETRLSFGDADELWDTLRIRKGSVSLLNIVDADMPRPDMEFLADAEILKSPRIGVHPNDNAATIIFAPERIPEIFARYGMPFRFL